MTRRYSYGQALASLRGAQSSFGRALVRSPPRGEWAEAMAKQARLAMAKAERAMVALAVDARTQDERRRSAA